MKVSGLDIANDKGLTNFDLNEYAQKLKIINFRGVFIRDTIPYIAYNKECGIVNLNCCDSFGQVTPLEFQKYLKTKREYDSGIGVIQRNTDIVQRTNTHVCGHLCLFVLTSLTRKHRSYQDVLNQLNDGYTQGDW